MRNVLGYLLIVIALISCKSDEDKATESAKKMLLDESFKDNKKAEILEFKLHSLVPATEGLLDTFKILQLSNRISAYRSEVKEILGVLQEQEDLENIIGASISSKKSSIELAQKALNYNDSVSRLMQEDSIIRARIEGRVNPKSNYKYGKFFLKGTFGDKNVMDTMHVVFDNEFKVIFPESK